MSATTAKVAARSKTDNTGITPELSTKMYKNLGSNYMAIVELRVAERIEGDDQSHAVKLEVNRIEPAADKDIEDHMRALERALYFKRNPQPTLTQKDPLEANVTKVMDKTGQTVLNCALCEHKYADTKISHARGAGPEWPPCVWSSCGHVVDFTEPKVCTKSHTPVDDDEKAKKS